jgi:Ca-activated chloride channel family protein
VTYGQQTGRSGARRAVPLVIAAVVGLVLVLVVRAVVSGGGDDGGGTGGGRADGSGQRTGCTALKLTASSEKAALLTAIAADYNRSDRRVAGTCVDVAVTSKASGGAAEALARGWDERVDGPRPDVWSPASSGWTALLRQRTAAQDKGDLVPSQLPSIAQTPLVIAMPRPMAEALGWPGKALGWGDVLALARDPRGWGAHGHAEWGAFKLGKTNPDFSTSGLNATIAAYFAATGRSSDLTAKDVRDPKVVAYVKAIEGSVVHYGDTTLTFLDNLYSAAEGGRALTYISAVTVEEKSVWDYNQGNPSGDPGTLGQRGKPRVPLVAVYPKEGTLLSDNPYVVLRAEWVDEAKRKAAADFLAYVKEPAQQKRFTEAAFRDAAGTPGGPITAANGLNPQAKLSVIDPPAPAVLDQVSRSWSQLRKRARVLIVMDVSGSMNGAVPGNGGTKLDLAKQAARGAVGKLAPDDELGLWTFSTPVEGRSTPWLELVPTAPVRTVLPTFRSKVDNLQAEGGTALYATTRAAVRAVQGSFDRDRINAVVLLTDGKNEYPQDNDLPRLVSDLGGEESTDTSVRVFPIAYGDKADLGVLKQIAQASRAAAYDATDPATIEKVLVAVLSNF